MTCTKKGKEWLTAALDPFHDSVLELAGLPDPNGSNSFVLMQKQSFVLSAPATAGTSWSAAINITGITSRGQYSSYNTLAFNASVPPIDNGSIVLQALGSGPGFNNRLAGPIMAAVYPTATASPYWTFVDTASTNGVETNAFGENTGTPCRIIGIAFEVTDVTPVQFQQGTCTVYRAATSKIENLRVNVGAGTFGSGFVTYSGYEEPVFSNPISDSATALLIPDSLQWAASEGCYMVGKFFSLENLYPAPANSPNSGLMPLDSGGFFMNTNPQNNGLSQILRVFGCGNHSGLTPSGAIFEGLSTTNGALRVTSRIIYEYFPVLSFDPFLPLATPSAPYDSCALLMYSEAMARLPPATKVADNLSGDWFRSVGKALATGASLFPGVVGSVGRVALSLMDDKTNARVAVNPSARIQPPVTPYSLPRAMPARRRRRRPVPVVPRPRRSRPRRVTVRETVRFRGRR